MVLSVDPGFVMYRMIAGFVGMDYVGVPLLADGFGLDMPALLAAIERHQPAVLFLAYPNNPTGNLFDPGQMRELIAAAPGLVVVDEAYAPFADASFLGDLGAAPNLVVMRTVSKMGLAGLRLGMLAGDPACPVLRPREHDRRGEAVFLKHVPQQIQLLARVHRVDGVLDRRCGPRGVQLDHTRLTEEAVGQRTDLLRHRRREEQVLTIPRQRAPSSSAPGPSGACHGGSSPPSLHSPVSHGRRRDGAGRRQTCFPQEITSFHTFLLLCCGLKETIRTCERTTCTPA